MELKEDTAGTFMKAVLVSFMFPDNRFGQSKVRAKILDGKYFLKLAIADYKKYQGTSQELGESFILGI